MSHAIRTTAFSRDDDIDALEHKTMWLIRDRRSPVRLWNFETNSWSYAHLFDGPIPDAYLSDMHTVMITLPVVERK